jgi:DNA-binding NarL/FixJ family response regulator
LPCITAPLAEQPDVVLLDVTQDIGMEEVALVAAKWRNLALLALGSLERREEAVRHGRARFVARDANIQDLQSAISDAVAGRMQVSGRAQRRAHWGTALPRAAVDAGAGGSELDEPGDRGFTSCQQTISTQLRCET